MVILYFAVAQIEMGLENNLTFLPVPQSIHVLIRNDNPIYDKYKTSTKTSIACVTKKIFTNGFPFDSPQKSRYQFWSTWGESARGGTRQCKTELLLCWNKRMPVLAEKYKNIKRAFNFLLYFRALFPLYWMRFIVKHCSSVRKVCFLSKGWKVHLFIPCHDHSH